MLRLSIKPLYFFTLFLVAWLLTGCDGNGKAFISTIDAGKNKVVSIKLKPASEDHLIIEVGQSQAFEVTATRKDGSTYTVDNKYLIWSVSCSQDGCARIDKKGMLTTSRDSTGGDATVTARYSNFSSSAVIKVSDAELTSITIKKHTAGQVINLCQSIELDATGAYSDGTTRNITGISDWGVVGGNTQNAQIYQDQSGSKPVFLSTSTSSAVDVTASRKALSGKLVTSKQTFSVTGILPDSISITPSNATIDLNGKQQFDAKGIWAGSSGSITRNVEWKSDDTNVLGFSSKTTSVNVSEREDGLASGKTVGNTTIQASCSSSVSGTANVTVEKRVISKLIIKRKDGTAPEADDTYKIPVDPNSPVSFVAYPVYTDGTTSKNDVTQQAIWTNDSQTPGDTSSIFIGQVANATDAKNKRGNITGEQKTASSKGNAFVVVRLRGDGPQESWPAGYFYVEVE